MMERLPEKLTRKHIHPYLTLDAVLKAICETLCIKDTRHWTVDQLHYISDLAWATSCSLYLEPTPAAPNSIVQVALKEAYPDKDLRAYRIEAKISWSSTHRTVSEALSAITLYREFTEMAALAEAIGGRYFYIEEDPNQEDEDGS